MRLKNLKQTTLITTSVLVLCGLVSPASAEEITNIDDVLVTATRLPDGIVGASSTIITEEDIKRSPANTIQDLLSREAGIQVRSLFGSTAGSRDVVDMRGFGASATDNTLILINGRRVGTPDLAGVNFTAFSKDTISRIEIIRGGSGGVLYGDGAQGGVINIITKAAGDQPDQFLLESKFGSYGYYEENLLLRKSIGNVTALLTANVIDSNGYRDNNELEQRNVMGEIRRHEDWGSAYFKFSGDYQTLGLPGTRSSTQLDEARRGAATPRDYSDQQGLNGVAGFNYQMSPNTEVIVDGGMRFIGRQAEFFFGNPYSYIDTELFEYSLTPRSITSNSVFGKSGQLTWGVDLYHYDYDSKRSTGGSAPVNRTYKIDQTNTSIYAQQKIDISEKTKASFGGRLQHVHVDARDDFVFLVPFGTTQIPSTKSGEFEYSLHLGAEQQVTDNVSFFGRLARSIRVPNVDERVGSGGTNFDLKIQKSYDAEIGFKYSDGAFDASSSAYFMRLKDEIHLLPEFGTFNQTNINLDPTERYGVENTLGYQLSDNIRLKGNLNYTRAQFVKGQHKGNDIPLVSRWTAGTGVSWNLFENLLILDADVRYVGRKRFDNDQRNVQPYISGHTLVDLKVGGSAENLGWIDRLSWSVGIENLFDKNYYNYGIASQGALPGALGAYNAYPMPGRTYMANLKLEF